MDLYRAIACIVIFVACITSSHAQGPCTGMTPCYCKFANGQFLDIAALGRTDGSPRFVNVSDKHELTYSWNPCFNFTEGDCHDVALCSMEPSIPHDIYRTLGYQNNTSFITNTTDNSVTLVYRTQTRSSYIHLICDRENINATYFTAIGPKSQTSSEYTFELKSALACPQGTPTVTSTAAPSTPRSDSINKKLEGALIAVSLIAFIALVLLSVALLKIKGILCKTPQPYEEL